MFIPIADRWLNTDHILEVYREDGQVVIVTNRKLNVLATVVPENGKLALKLEAPAFPPPLTLAGQPAAVSAPVVGTHEEIRCSTDQAQALLDWLGWQHSRREDYRGRFRDKD